MLVLALDSSTRSGSIALARDGHLLEVRAGDPSIRHAVRLPGDLIALLAAHGHALHDVQLFAAATGPGGFTGLRVGLATVQGLAMALDRRVYVASTLDLLALAGAGAAPGAPCVGAWMRGMRDEVFTALYTVERGGRPARLIEPTVGQAADMADAWVEAGEGRIAVIGDAWPALGAPLVARFGDRLHGLADPPLAGVLAMDATAHADRAIPPAAIRPTYVRRPDAVVAREQAGHPTSGER